MIGTWENQSPMNTFIDTGAFYALADRSDSYHSAASKYYADALTDNRFFTTSFALVESWLLIRNKLGYDAAQNFLGAIRKGIVTITDVSAADLDKAWTILNTYADQEFSLVDAVSFAVMERLKVTNAFAFDEHFRLYRFGARKELLFTLVP
jgi:predicted nucleic acid-binding protein